MRGVDEPADLQKTKGHEHLCDRFRFRFIYLVILQTQETSAKTKSGRCRRGHPACLYRKETLAMTELQQQRLQVCENNWVRKIARLTRADEGRMVEIRQTTEAKRLSYVRRAE